MGRKRKSTQLKCDRMRQKRSNISVVPTSVDNTTVPVSANTVHVDATNDSPPAPAEKVVERRRETLSKLPTPSKDSGEVSDEYLIMSKSKLNQLIQKCSCSSCGGKLYINFENINGFATDIKLCCCNCPVSHTTTSSPRLDGKKNAPFDINRRMAVAVSKIGKGHAAMQMFAGFLNMNSLSSRSFTQHVKQLKFASQKTVQTDLEKVRILVKKAYVDVPADEPIDISVSFDATWQKRGHTSNFSAGCVIDMLTGYVLDYEVLSKVCEFCNVMGNNMGWDSPEFLIWNEGHAPYCDANYKGSSGGMEVEIATILWKRSVDYGLRYTTLLADGDAKTFSHLKLLNIYGDGVTLEKEECINHVGKRMYTALDKLVSTEKKQGITLGGKKYGQLTQPKIKRITKYYRNAIKYNTTLDAMKTSIYAILCHCGSTDKKHNHKKCPQGEKSWCFFNKALAQGKKPISHKKGLSTALTPHIIEKMMPTFQRLASDNLLKRCTKGKTQNANESIHQMIWAKCPKTIKASKQRVDMAASDAVMEFNRGLAASVSQMQKDVKLRQGVVTLKLARRKDKIRFRKSDNSKKVAYQLYRRKVLLAKMCLEEKYKKTEGIAYAAGGGFDSD